MRAIKGFNGYFITEEGKVWSQKTLRWIQTTPNNTTGYPIAKLYKNGKQYYKTVHRLVAEAFLPKTKEDIKLGRDCIDHIDGNRQNNHVSNLRWCTNKENSNFELALENRSKAHNKPETKERHSRAKSKPIIIDGVEYKSATEASEILNIPRQTIHNRLKSKKFENYQYAIDKGN